MTDDKRKAIDWEAVERDYRTTNASLAALSERYGVSRQSIHRRATAKFWQRDLREQVRVRAAAMVMSGSDKARKDEEIVEGAALDAAGVILRHRSDLAAWGQLVCRVRDTLMSVKFTEENVGKVAGTIRQAVDAHLALIKAERVAYALDDDEGKRGDSLEQRLAQMLDEAGAR